MLNEPRENNLISKYTHQRAIWVDFTENNLRDFRLGVIADRKIWNPDELEDLGNVIEAHRIHQGFPPRIPERLERRRLFTPKELSFFNRRSPETHAFKVGFVLRFKTFHGTCTIFVYRGVTV